MPFRYLVGLSLTIVLVFGWLSSPTHGQNVAPDLSDVSRANDGQEAARRQLLESDRWRQARRALNEWLSIQQLYSPDEVAVLRSEFRARVERMSPTELMDQLENLEDKLSVLASPEVEEARRWLSQFLSVQAKYSEAELRQRRPDIANMTASQIRQELVNFQQRRGVTQQTHAVAAQGRAIQVQATQEVRQAQQRANEEARNRASSNIANTQFRSPYAPRRDDLPGHSDPDLSRRPYYTVGPWGNPIRWDPLAGFW